MDGLVDIHAHLLPGIDDGPADLDAAIAMARAAAAAGTQTLVATPHLRSDFPDVHLNELTQRCQSLREAIEAEDIPLRVVCGAEISLVWALEASPEQLTLASYGQRGTDLLIETPLTAVGGLGQHLFHLQAKGFRITLAHPERNAEFQNDQGLIEDLVRRDVVIQVNAGSVIDSGRKSNSRRLARHMCSSGLIHVLSSDGHRPESWRPVTALRAGVEAAAALVGTERAVWMARDSPAAVVEGVALPEPPAILAQPRRKRLFGRRL